MLCLTSSSSPRTFALVALLVAGCETSTTHGLGRDAAETDTCEARAESFESYVDAHASCAIDADCAVIGDCGPNADFRAVRADAAAHARELQIARCSSAYDGPVYDPICVDGTCSLQRRTDTCCGCLPVDAGDGG